MQGFIATSFVCIDDLTEISANARLTLAMGIFLPDIHPINVYLESVGSKVI